MSELTSIGGRQFNYFLNFIKKDIDVIQFLIRIKFKVGIKKKENIKIYLFYIKENFEFRKIRPVHFGKLKSAYTFIALFGLKKWVWPKSKALMINHTIVRHRATPLFSVVLAAYVELLPSPPRKERGLEWLTFPAGGNRVWRSCRTTLVSPPRFPFYLQSCC